MIHSVALRLNQKAFASSELAAFVDAVWQSRLRLPPGIAITTNTDEVLELEVQRRAFALEPDAFVLLTLRPIRLAPPLLVPVTTVRQALIRRTPKTLKIFVLCTSRETVSLKEANRLARRPSLPPGIHHPAALQVTGGVSPHEVSGGLPSLGKKR